MPGRGGEQAKAVIWARCFPVITTGRPGRGASLRQAEGAVLFCPTTQGLPGHVEGLTHLDVGFASVEFKQAQGAFVDAGVSVPFGDQRGQRVSVFGGELDVLFGHDNPLFNLQSTYTFSHFHIDMGHSVLLYLSDHLSL